MSIREAALARALHYAEWDAQSRHQFEKGQNQGPLVDHALAFVGLDNKPNPASGYPYCAAGACLCIGEALGFPDKATKAEVHTIMRHGGVLPSASVSAMREYAQDKGAWHPATIRPDIGWLVVFKFSHIGFVKARMTDSLGKVVRLKTVEFNTQSRHAGDQRDGGGVYVRERELSQVSGYIEVP